MRLTLGTPLERVETGSFTVTRSEYRPHQQLPSHAHELASATIVLRGSVTERVAGRRFECPRDRMLLRPAAVRHSNSYGQSGAECVIIGAQPAWVESDATARAVFSAPRLAATATSLAAGQRIRRELRIGDHASALAIEGLTLELIASVAREMRDPSCRVAPSWLRAIRDRLHDEYATTIRLTSLAHEASVHPVHLTRAFRQCYGCTPGEFLRQRRIERACLDLSESDRSIAEIALAAGFSSPSHFATIFHRLTGLTPRTYRATTSGSRRFRT